MAVFIDTGAFMAYRNKNDFFTKNRVKTALRVGAGNILFVNENGA